MPIPKKLSVLTGVLLVITLHLSAQELINSFGVKMSGLVGTASKDNSSPDVTIQVNELSYFPRYNFLEGDNASLSIGLPLGAGIGIANSDYGDVGVMLAYDLPVAIDFNFGNKATTDNDRYFGGYAGVGFGYSHVQIAASSYSDFTGVVYGPLLRAGVRVSSPDPSWNGHALKVGVYLKKGLGPNQFYMGGFNILYLP